VGGEDFEVVVGADVEEEEDEVELVVGVEEEGEVEMELNRLERSCEG
jgi:hypothetical protein